MAAIQRSEFALALNQIASERGVDPAVVLETMKGAILAAYRKDNPEAALPEEGEEDPYSVALNESTGETSVMKDGKDITPPGFGRIAAQTAKQVLLQKIREKEKDAIVSEYTKRVGTVVNGMILRFLGPNIIVDIGKAEAIIEPVDKIPNEQYFLNKKMPVLIRAIDDEKRDILVSRSNPGLIEGLLRREVPEVNSGSVIIKNVVREPGNRAKIAVYSEASGIDPVGSCVGQKGVRIQAVIDALDGLEKIDVIQWNPDPVKFITNALSPAKNLVVEIDEKKKAARVRAPQEELPLIIGREGQNVRLASKLTEYTIEVEGDPTMKMPEEETPKKEKPKEEGTDEVKEDKGADVPVDDKPVDETADSAEEKLVPEDAAAGEVPVAEATPETPEEIPATDLVETPADEESSEAGSGSAGEKPAEEIVNEAEATIEPEVPQEPESVSENSESQSVGEPEKSGDQETSEAEDSKTS
jgi:transcription termination/antitermination protein NusA